MAKREPASEPLKDFGLGWKVQRAKGSIYFFA